MINSNKRASGVRAALFSSTRILVIVAAAVIVACRAEEPQSITKGQTMDNESNIVIGETAKSPAESAANALNLSVEASKDESKPSLVLHGYYNISADLAGRYSQSLPSPIYVVAVSHHTGNVYIQSLINDDDIPADYLGESAPATVVLQGPKGPSSKGISESAHFSVNLKHHLALPDAADTFDIFLWLDDVLSESLSISKRLEQGQFKGSNLYESPRQIAVIKEKSLPLQNNLSFVQQQDGLHLTGSIASNRASLVVFSINSQQPGWTVLESTKGNGLAFDIKVEDFFNGRTNEKIMALLVVDGQRLPLVTNH